jgi:spore germination protein YaaH
MIKKLLLVTFAVIGLTAVTSAQQYKSVVQEQNEKYSVYNFQNDQQWDSLFLAENPGMTRAILPKQKSSCVLNKVVYGWNPYWAGTTYVNYQWNLLSHLCHFSYELNYATGNPITTHNWATDDAVDSALAHGVKVDLCVTLMNQANLTSFLDSSNARQTLITNLINLIQVRGANGVNIDFEGMASSDSADFKTFMISLCNQMHAAIPGSQVSYCLPAVEWSSNTYSVKALIPYVDMFIIMGYDYYYGGSPTAGPTDPLYNFLTGYNYTLTKSITYYLSKGVPPPKLILGLPYYGKQWATNSDTIGSGTTAAGTSPFYNTVRTNSSGNYSTKRWNETSFTPYYTFQTGSQWYQCWIDDAYSLGRRFEMINHRGIGGMGIWALGYDDGYTELWDKIRDNFTNCATVPCVDTIYDMGGPLRNYYDKENYSYTIAPTGASSLSLAFTSFSTEANYDTLRIYDGPNTSSPLIGAYHGTNSPGTINSTGPSLTVKFRSDNATNSTGWKAVWHCLTDNVAPATVTNVSGDWQTQNFTATFTDTDNSGGTGIEKSYYQVIDYNGTEWHANSQNGFFSDNFDTYNAPVWSVPAGGGAWSVVSGNLVQSDTTLSNTNIFASLNQNLSNRYLYQFTIKLDPAGTTAHRFGFHFFSDSGSMSNRGNSYFIFFRQETSKLEFYKVIGDTYSQTKVVDNITTTFGQWYDIKVIFDRITGKIDVYRDDIFLASWTDPVPLVTTGKYISFRTGNSKLFINELKVFRSRASSVSVSIGAAPTNDIRYQNPDPATYVAKIKSIVNDAAGNLSAIDVKNLNIDWTAPLCDTVNDGTGSDTDTTTSTTELSSNWAASSDPNSGIIKYFYAIGTTPGDTNVTGWTDNALNTSVTKTGLALTDGQAYYFSVKTENGAGLTNICNSNGVMVFLATNLSENENVTAFSVYPNPFGESATINFQLSSDQYLKIALTDMLGMQIIISDKLYTAGKHSITLNSGRLQLSKGIYFLEVSNEKRMTVEKIIHY